VSAGDPVRLDKWLWAARIYKTRSLAAAAVTAGEVRVGGERVKPARLLKVGDAMHVRRGNDAIDLVVAARADGRGPAPGAPRQYEETDESRRRRAAAAERRAVARDPAVDLRGRPTKREGRLLRRLRSEG
jgi:ribosome-associated heat shock protein Hsp15